MARGDDKVSKNVDKLGVTAVELAEFQVMEKDNSPLNLIRESKFVSSMMSPIS